MTKPTHRSTQAEIRRAALDFSAAYPNKNDVAFALVFAACELPWGEDT